MRAISARGVMMKNIKLVLGVLLGRYAIVNLETWVFETKKLGVKRIVSKVALQLWIKPIFFVHRRLRASPFANYFIKDERKPAISFG